MVLSYCTQRHFFAEKNIVAQTSQSMFLMIFFF